MANRHPILSQIGRTGQKLTGDRGLVVAIIAQAVRDYYSRNSQDKASAVSYFASPWYQEHLNWLGLEPTMLPEGVQLPEYVELPMAGD